MRNKYIRHIIIFATTLLVAISYYFFVFTPLKKSVVKNIELEFIHETKLQTLYIDNELKRDIEGAKSISSRSMIRNKIVDYRNGRISLAQLKKYTSPKYSEGLKTLENCNFAQRFVDTSIIATYGLPTGSYNRKISDTIVKSVSSYALIRDSILNSSVISPIFYGNSVVGFDVMYFRNNEIVGNLEDKLISLEVFTKSNKAGFISGKNNTLSDFKTNSIKHQNARTTYLVKSEIAPVYYLFSAPTKVLYKNIWQLEKHHLLFVLVASGLVLIILSIFHRLTQQFYLQKGKFFEELASKRELELLKSHREYKQLFELVNVGVVVISKEGIITNYNGEFARIFEIDTTNKKSEKLEDIYTKLLHKDGSQVLHDELASTKAKKEQRLINDVEIGIKHKEGNIVWTLVSALPKITGDGLIISFTDITQQINNEKKLESLTEDLRTANATKDKFFSIISHDLRNPLGNMINVVELLNSKIQENDFSDMNNCVSLLGKSTQKSYKLLEQLLQWSRLQSDTIKVNPNTFQLLDIINNITELHGSSIDQKQISLVTRVPDKLKVNTDIFMFETILRNLLSNAIKFTPQNGEISIIAEQYIDQVVISVKDTGTGMNDDTITKLFKLTDNTSTPGTNNEPGTGLGLILCKEFVEKMGGKIWVESIDGKGSTFSFSLLK